jgi:hypothetical protein
METPPLDHLLDEAVAAHGHLCPSLVYGCRLAVVLMKCLPPDAALTGLMLRHTSACFRDGVNAALLPRHLPGSPVSVREPGSCSLEAVWDGGALALAVRPEVRRRVDAFKEGRDLEAYRAAVVAYLLGLADDELIDLV